MKVPTHHDLPEEYVLKDVFSTEINTVYFYKNIVVVEAKEGITLSYKTAFPILVTGLKMLGRKPWVYIANRIHSYAVNPNDYVYLEKIPTLKGIALVTYDEIGRKNAEMESMFFKKHFHCCDDLSSAFSWAKGILEKA
ncbi:MAG: hypothetical protein R2793_04650 [Flavobacteriaceae bacterium]